MVWAWSIPKVEGLAPSPRGGHSLVAVGSKVILFGGADRTPNVFDDLWVLETDGGSFDWTRISPLFAPGCTIVGLSGATLTAIGDKVYLFGGQDPVNSLCSNDLRVLDTASWQWSNVEVQGSRPPPRHSHCAGCLAGSCLIVYGGAGHDARLSDVWIFNPDQAAWNSPHIAGQQPEPREMASGVMVSDTQLVVFGGRGDDDRMLCDVARFDAAHMTWDAIEPTPFTRCAHSAVAIPNAGLTAPDASGTSVLVYGGFSGEAVEGDVMRIDATTLEIEVLRRGPREADEVTKAVVPPCRFAHAAVAIPTRTGMGMLVVGGVTPFEDLNDIALYSGSV